MSGTTTSTTFSTGGQHKNDSRFLIAVIALSILLGSAGTLAGIQFMSNMKNATMATTNVAMVSKDVVTIDGKPLGQGKAGDYLLAFYQKDRNYAGFKPNLITSTPEEVASIMDSHPFERTPGKMRVEQFSLHHELYPETYYYKVTFKGPRPAKVQGVIVYTEVGQRGFHIENSIVPK